MFKIREFAEIAQVSTSTLRYYDDIGLFKPMRVDAETGYRYYAIDQLLRLNRILALKALGFELTQITACLDEELSPDALQGMLRLRQAKLQQHIQAEQEQLAHIEARLKYIEREGNNLSHEVVLKAVKSFPVISSRTQATGFLPNVHYANAFLDMLKQKEVSPDGPLLYLYNESSFSPVDFDVEIAVPIEHSSGSRLAHDAGVIIQHLPEVPQMASILHHGSPHAIVEAYQALGTWIGVHGYTIAGPCRKVCLCWKGELNDYLTEVQFPVEKQP
ncbi:MerR family transcriptional regulator [Ktedonobacter sp. SOSP1-52]|uniref:MerR family transcriptional regulator n=1 Tax=Ktedonobacter sp. SOSP1-52 TaxID=2778366 RepID=UPI0019154A78|nr:MerR family transcriptional regulator [Ktedonobacter sp. SOSP1-52]GHO68143.1 MerR family transcriptional regulator [Ktedonobacter sp. SOSP1-52]